MRSRRGRPSDRDSLARSNWPRSMAPLWSSRPLDSTKQIREFTIHLCPRHIFSERWSIQMLSNVMEQSSLQENAVLSWTKMEHPNVVKCHGAVKFAGECGLVMERMHCSLDGFLCTTKYISLRQVFHFATEIIKGLDYIHDLHVGHRDIKPANVLLQLNDGLHVTKIADFGVSRELFLVGDVRESDTVTIVGTRGYMAPEIRPGRAYDPYLADVYSYGKLLQGLLGHCQSGESQPKTELQDLANKCSSIDPSSRPTSYRILRSLQGTETAFIREVAEFDRQNPPSPLDQEWIQRLRDNLSQPDDLTE
eukprot:TRINITY_DN8135_c0_g1_i1.p1 TRINITY_DN8135_c0_g1~~TRINITY_DN8135_c0_g1_i1.p1  ORF type:complete len:307 (-),score=56.90 TRINITY_DN8135_c0_g1_i1:49-969(-)